MRFLLHAVGWVCLVCGAIGALASLWSFLDPVGMRMANAANPSGTPPPTEQIVLTFLFCLAAMLFGIRSIRRSPSK